MACSCDSCSSPRIIKTRTALFWRWLAQSREETADRVIPARASAPIGPVTLAPQETMALAEARTGGEAVTAQLSAVG
jgi:hypothetical protein